MKHYHIYIGAKDNYLPSGTKTFRSSEQAIEAVIKFLDKLGITENIDLQHHSEPELGRFSTIVVPSYKYKIILHECVHDCENQTFSNSELKKHQLN